MMNNGRGTHAADGRRQITHDVEAIDLYRQGQLV